MNEGRRLSSTARHELVPPWLENLAALGWRILATVLLGIVAVFVATRLATATASILIAIIIASTFAPFVLALRQRGWSRTKAAAAVTLGALVVSVVVLTLIATAFVPYVVGVLQGIGEGSARLRSVMADVAVPSAVSAGLDAAVSAVSGAIADVVATIAGGLAGATTVAVLALFLTFFFLQDGDKAWAWLFQSAPAMKRDPITSAGDDALLRVGGYLRGMATLAAAKGIADFVFLTVLGVPLAAPLAVLVFVGGFIPYVGGFVATSVVLLVTLASNGSRDAIVLLVLIGITNVILGDVVAPLVYRRSVSIHPAVVLLALPAGAAVAGIVGLFVAIPIVAMAMAVGGAVITVLDPGPDVERHDLVPGWLDRLGQWSSRLLIAAALAALGIALLTSFSALVVAVTVAVILAATIQPLVIALVRRGWRVGLAAIVVTGGVAIGIVAGLALAIVSLVSQADAIAAASRSGATAVDASSGGLLGALTATVGAAIGVIKVTTTLAPIAASLVVVLLLATLLCVYFLRDGAPFWDHLVARLPAHRAADVDQAGSRAVGVLGGYMGGTAAISAFGALTQLAIMAILGIPLALPLAVLSFFGGFIPYIGSFVTTGIALLVTVALGSPFAVAVMALFTIVFNIVQGNFVAPLVYGRAVNLHPAVVLIAIPAGNEVAGILGMFLAVPFIGVVAATWRSVLHAFDPEPANSEDVEVREVPPVPGPERGDLPPVPVLADGGA